MAQKSKPELRSRLGNKLLNHPGAPKQRAFKQSVDKEEFIREIRKYSEVNENEDTIYQNMGCSKAVLGKFVDKTAYIKTKQNKDLKSKKCCVSSTPFQLK